MGRDYNKSTTIKQEKQWLRLMSLGKICGCHQLSERSFFYKQFQFPLCARCTGVLIGQLISLILFFLTYFSWFIILGLIPLIVDGLLQYLRIVNSTNFRRIVTGLLGGFSFGIFVLKLCFLLI